MRRQPPVGSGAQASATIFLIMRRMRAPLIILILIFAVSVLGLTIVPGQDAAGHPTRMSFFDAFYFMSYTATTIGFGELPDPFTDAQRMWVTITIYLTVIGWAYAIGSLLTPAPGPGVSSCAGAATILPEGAAAAGAVPVVRRVRPDRRTARPGRSMRWASSSW